MTWWVFSYLDNYRPPHGLAVLARTPEKAHMFIRWSKIKPARRLRYRNIRGLTKWCGYTYWWTDAHTHEQLQPGDTYEHLFGLIPLDPWDHVWYYLFSMMTAPPLEHQGPLIHVPPPELPMPSARIFHSAPQVFAAFTTNYLTFDSVLWDDYHFYDPAQPDRLTIPAGALYQFGCDLRFLTAFAHNCWAKIRLVPFPTLCHHSHAVSATGWAGAAFTLSTILPLRPGDALRVQVYSSDVAGYTIVSEDRNSPHFWIAQIGSYPISPP